MILVLDQGLLLLPKFPVKIPGDLLAFVPAVAVDVGVEEDHPDHGHKLPEVVGPEADLAGPGDDPGTVWVRGTAYDLEDGAVTSDSLVWSSDVDGYLGTGDDLVPTLTPGNHVLTLTATDAHGMTGTAAVAVSIPGTFAEEGGSNLVWGGIGAGGGLVLGLLAAFGLSRIGRRPKVFCPAGHPGTGAAFCTVCGGPVPPAPPEAGGAARTASFAAVAVILAAAGGAVGWIVTPQSSDGAIGIAQIGAVDEAVVAPSADPAQPAMLLTAAALETSGDLLPPGTDTSDPAADPFLIGGIAEATGLGEDGSVMWDVVPADDGGLRGIGYRTFPEGVGATLWESPDGHSWTALDIPALGEGGASILTAAVDAAPIVLGRRVVDGNWQFSSWSRGATGAWALGTADQLTGNGATPMAAAAVDGGFVAVGYVNTTAGLDMAWWHSTDGHHWRSGAPLEPGDQAAFGLAQSGDTVVAVGVHQTDGDQTFAIEDGSEDGAVWVWDGNGFARVLSPAFGTELQELMWDVVATDDGFVAGGRTYTDAADPVDAAVWVSPDGLTWESRPVEPALEGDQSEVIDRLMAAPDGSVVAAGRVGGADLDLGIWHSVDGRTWELVVHQTAPGLQIPRRIRMIGGTAVAAGMSDDGAAVWVIEPG